MRKYLRNYINSLTSSKIEELKNFLDEHTFIGEYLGGFFNQHITIEKEEKVVFFSITKKNSFINDILDMKKSEEIIKNFGLQFVEYDLK